MKWNLEQTKQALENILTDYHDGLYNEHQYKFMIKQLARDTEVSVSDFSEMLLEIMFAARTL